VIVGNHARHRREEDKYSEQPKNNLRRLPEDIAPAIKKGLLEAHTKLSDYYTKFDESPYYTWAARASSF
jgi:hypothetical protein